MPCTCWLTESQPKTQPDDLGPGTTPLWIAVTRLREQATRPHLRAFISVRVEDVEQVLDALVEAERVIPWDRGGEA